MIAFFGTGLMHSMLANRDAILDLVWVDLVVNMHLLSIARVGLAKEKLTKPEVVLICAYPFDQRHFLCRYDHIMKAQRKFPYSKCFGHYNIQMISCPYYFALRVIVYQVIPSIFVDLLLKASNMKPMAMSAQRKMFAGCKDLAYFCSKSLPGDGPTELANLVLLSKNSPFSVQSYFEAFNMDSTDGCYDSLLLGTRKYLLRDDESSLPAARRRYKM